ncbi:MAG: putative quinol monooxygenase [Vicinamibacterales bacterium]
MGRIVIVGYRPKPGKAEELRALTREHVEILRTEGLATDRAALVMEAKDGTVVEVFEWTSKEAINSAHTNPRVLELWTRYAAVCDYVPVGTLEEAGQLFSEFTPL